MKHKHHIVPKHMGGSDDPSNLVELTVEEHAEAHRLLFEQYGHWEDEVAWKCLAGIIGREELVSRVISETQKGRFKDGTHHFIGMNEKKIKDGTHHFLEGRIHKKSLEDGTHRFLDSEWQRNNQKKLIEKGTHHFLSGEIQRKNNLRRVKEGTHPFIDSEFQRKNNLIRVEKGTHHFLGGEMQRRTQRELVAKGLHCGFIVHTCPHCGKVGKGPTMFRYHFDACKRRGNQ